MKRTILSLLTFMVVMVAWADDITAQQALQQAQSFIQQRETVGSRPKRIKGSPMKLTMVKQVSGLYLFNINNNGGFVIVSNDDRTRPILGFSDSGAIDPDNMPNNMRAWLQGYADEIAWAKQHNIATVTNVGKATSTGPVNAPRRVGSHSTKSIAPLVSTTWNQDAPYNNMTPYYYYNSSTGNISYNTTGGSNYQHCATGCVATAMAQVMKYHQWPQGSTQQIPSYQWERAGITLPSLSATTFNWANMLNSYSGSYTTAQGNAVATLMKYCGYSVLMDYGPESGSNTDLVADALRNYFGYNTTTTQFVSRSFYTSAKWADLIYYELDHNRPVVYGGMSSGGGHEFVCDGYKYEDDTDFFHINWGWGGMSDEYFVLSALDPYSQGIGGSSSNDGFHYGQDAVIGIQPSTSSGSTANITPNVIDLTLNSMTPDRNPTIVNTEVNIKLNITNNSSDDYEGDIYIGRDYGSYNYGLLAGNNYTIPAGETKEIVIPFTPTSTGTYNLVLFLPNTIGSYSTNCQVYASLEVITGTSNSYVPIYGYYCDNYSRSQFIIPASNLQNMANTTVTGVTFYSNNQSVSWGDAKFDVCLKEVSGTTLSALEDWDAMQCVYSGSLSINNGKMTIAFNTPYQYNGGNLLVGINQTTKGSYNSCNWIGTTVSGASMGGYGTSISQRNFLPVTSFDYVAPGTPVMPTNVTASNITATTATITWSGANDSYNMRYRIPKGIKYDFESAEPWVVDAFPPFSTYDGDGLSTYGISGASFTNQEYTGSVIAFQNGIASSFTAHSGNAFGCFMDAIPSNGQYNNDFLITPEVEITPGMVFSFWARSATSQYGLERFKVGVYEDTDGTFSSYLAGSATAFEEAPTSWTQYTYDLSAYVGQTIRLAINCVSQDAFAFCIDDVFLGVSANDTWEETITGITSPYVLKGLTPNTTYEVQVQAVGTQDTSDWTASTTFTTLEQSVVPGDANGDGYVTFTDVVAIVNYLLGKPSGAFVIDGADFNGDGKVSISDAVGLLYFLNVK